MKVPLLAKPARNRAPDCYYGAKARFPFDLFAALKRRSSTAMPMRARHQLHIELLQRKIAPRVHSSSAELIGPGTLLTFWEWTSLNGSCWDALHENNQDFAFARSDDDCSRLRCTHERDRSRTPPGAFPDDDADGRRAGDWFVAGATGVQSVAGSVEHPGSGFAPGGGGAGLLARAAEGGEGRSGYE